MGPGETSPEMVRRGPHLRGGPLLLPHEMAAQRRAKSLGDSPPRFFIARLSSGGNVDVATINCVEGRLTLAADPGSFTVNGAGKTLSGFSVGKLPRVAGAPSADAGDAPQYILTLAGESNFGSELCADFFVVEVGSPCRPETQCDLLESLHISGRAQECREAGARGLAGPPARMTGLLGDFYGDGRNSIVALSSSGTGTFFKILDVIAGDLAGSDWQFLDAEAWSTEARGRWLPNPTGEPWHQILAIRQPPAQATNWDMDVVVFGGSEYLLGRKKALAGTRSQYIYKGAKAPQEILGSMEKTYTNTHSMLICGPRTYASYPFFLEFLEASKNFTVAGEQIRVWATLLPPTEAPRDNCTPPTNSELTPFNDTEIFAGDPQLGYQDYEAWARLLAAVAQLYPHFVALNIDDFSHNLDNEKDVHFSPGLVARMTSTLRAGNPNFALTPTLYYSQHNTFVFSAHPGLGYALDQPLFYFRNDRQGPGPCAAEACPWGPAQPADSPRAGGCLAGVCCISTAANFAAEARDVLAYLPPGRRIQVGFYATGHSRLGNPDPLYVLRLMPSIMSHAGVAGITVYVFQNPALDDCFTDDPAWLSDKGCIVARLFREASTRQ